MSLGFRYQTNPANYKHWWLGGLRRASSVNEVAGSIPADYGEKKTNFLLFCKGEAMRFIMLPSPLLFLFVALIAVRRKKVNIN